MMQRYKKKRFGDYGWKDYNRACPYCGEYIAKYHRRCKHCGKTVKNRYGKVFPCN